MSSPVFFQTQKGFDWMMPFTEDYFPTAMLVLYYKTTANASINECSQTKYQQ